MLETRARGEPPNVKCNHVAARTMEQFRRLGLAADVRDAGLPADYPNDVAFRTIGHRHRAGAHPHPLPRATRYSDTSGPDGWWPTPEPPHRINQIYLEPILFAHAEAQAGRDDQEPLRSDRLRAGRARRDDRGARPRRRRRDHACAARYLIGCDGGRSLVRKAIGAVFAGTPVIQRVQSTYIRAPELLGLVRGERAWSCYASNPRRSGVCFAIDGKRDLARPQPPACRARTTSRRSTATRASAPSSASAPTSRTRSSARKTGSAAASSPTASATGASSSPATPRTSGCRTPATA